MQILSLSFGKTIFTGELFLTNPMFVLLAGFLKWNYRAFQCTLRCTNESKWILLRGEMEKRIKNVFWKFIILHFAASENKRRKIAINSNSNIIPSSYYVAKFRRYSNRGREDHLRKNASVTRYLPFCWATNIFRNGTRNNLLNYHFANRYGQKRQQFFISVNFKIVLLMQPFVKACNGEAALNAKKP